jgi:tetratricopeptide (TPR) repeat protein
MRYTFLVGLCFFVFQTILAQSPEKALRETLRKKDLHDTMRIKTLLNLGNFLSSTDSVMPALKYMQEALDLAEKKNLPKWVAVSHLVLGGLEKNLGNHTEALKSLRSALVGFEKFAMHKEYIHTQQFIGKVHEMQGNYDRALQYYQESRENAEKHKFTGQLAFAYNNIGNAYFYKQELKKAIEWQLKGIDLRKKTDSASIQYSYNDIAEVYALMGKRDSALYYLKKSHYVAEKKGDLQLLAWGAVNLASILDSVGRHKEAIEVAEKGLPIAQKLRLKDGISNIARYLGGAYAQDGALQKSIEMYELHIAYRDSLQTEQAAKEIAKLETNHEIERHAKEAQQVKAEKQQQQYWLIAALAGLVLLLGVAVMLVRLNTYRRKTNIILQIKNNEIQEANLEL